MKLLLSLFLVLLFSQNSFSQLANTRADVIKLEGSNYKVGKTDDGIPFIYYSVKQYSEASGNYDSVTAYYFNKENICYMVKTFEPISETNAWVIHLNKRYVREKQLLWKDYATEVYYDLFADSEAGIVVLSAFY